ncbi:unnamed protein product [Peniophora sp. CBMAI 1063]|nr:unnamed protein product [Peniophora sp. CBMAI 1063]
MRAVSTAIYLLTALTIVAVRAQSTPCTATSYDCFPGCASCTDCSTGFDMCLANDDGGFLATQCQEEFGFCISRCTF